jgi:hypothetical protein
MENLEVYGKEESVIDSFSLELIQSTMTKINAFHDIVKATLVPGIDYGLIPGTQKTILFKSGAENIIMLFGLTATFEILDKVPQDFSKETDFVAYTIRCTLTKNNKTVSDGVGTCNTMERKYQDKQPLDIANTILKMASKRAMIDSILHFASLSSLFAQEQEQEDKQKAKSIITVKDASQFILTFGKHKGQQAGEVYKQDYQYVQWVFQKGNNEILKKVFTLLDDAMKKQAKSMQKNESLPSESLQGNEEGFNDVNNKNNEG